MTHEIPLTKGYVARVDAVDCPELMLWRWYAQTTPKGAVYAARSAGRLTVLMHRHLMGRSHGDGIIVDHRNGDTMDYTRANLRVCTYLENIRNQKRRGKLLKGVKIRRRRFEAGITVNYAYHYLGLFPTEIEAGLAYDTAAKQFFGEFARLNFPNGHPVASVPNMHGEPQQWTAHQFPKTGNGIAP